MDLTHIRAWMRSPFGIMIVAGLAIRLIIAPLFTFNSDMAYWSLIISTEQQGMGLYETTSYHYTPPWGYVLAFVSLICPLLGVTELGTFVPDLLPYMSGDMTVIDLVPSMAFCTVIKIPLILVDLAVAYLIYKIVSERYDQRKATIASALWFLCPLVILESSVHVMFDNMAVLGALLAFILLSKHRYVLAGAAFSLAVLTKFFPIFLIFILIAIVFRKEGFTMEGVKALGKSVAGALAAFILLFLPSIAAGDFWQSMYFIGMRIGVTSEEMAAIFTPTVLIVIVIGLAVLLIAAWWAISKTNIIQRLLTAAPTEEFHRKLLKALAIVALLAAIVIIAITLLGGSEGTFAEVFTDLAMRIVAILSVISLLIEFYLAYRLSFIDNKTEKQAAALIMLSAIAVFLWPAAPQYVIFLIPFVAVYAAVHMPELRRPFIVFSVLFTVYQLVLSNTSILYTLSVYAGVPSLDSLIPTLDFMSSYVGEIPVIGFFMAVFGTASYIAMLYIPYKWYRCREVQYVEEP